MIGTISNALQGLFSASQTVNKAANNIATASSVENADTVNLSEEAVNMKLGEYAYKANLATIKTAQEMDKELMRLFDERV